MLEETLKHEYGHTVQLETMGVLNYINDVALPSVTAWVVETIYKLPFDYHSSPWESEADNYGGVNRNHSEVRPWNTSDGKYKYILDMLLGGII